MNFTNILGKAFFSACLFAGTCFAQTAIVTLTGALDSVQTALSVTPSSYSFDAFWAPGKTITVDSEQMTVCAANLGGTITICPGGRGVNGTTASSHPIGASVFSTASQALPATIVTAAAPVSCDLSAPVTLGVGTTTLVPATPGYRVNVCDILVVFNESVSAALLTSSNTLAGPWPTVSLFDRSFEGRLRTGIGEALRISITGDSSLVAGGWISWFLTPL